MTNEIELINDRNNGVIRVTVNGENAYSAWVYGGDNELGKKYLSEAREKAFIEACKLSGSKLLISENWF